VALKGDVFYGSLVIELQDQLYQVDARPSDSIALAVRAHVPILVNSAILKEAGIIPDVDIQANILDDTEDDEGSTPEEVEPEETKKRLSVFEDFLQNVDLDDMGDADSDNDVDDDTDADDEDGEIQTD
jgi:bifunctional DNase/RNase